MAALNFDSWALKRFGSDRQSTIQHYWPEIENAAQSIGASINGVSFIFDADFHKLIGTDNKRGKHSYTATIRQDGFPTITFQKIGCTSSRISCRDLAYQEWKRLKDQGLLDSKSISEPEGHCCKVSDEAAFCLIQRPYISKTLLTRRISPRGSP